VLFGLLPRELTPLEDRGRIWLRATAVEGASFDYMQRFMSELAQAVSDVVPEAQVILMQVPGAGGAPGTQGSVNSGFVRVVLPDRSSRERSQMEIAEDLQTLARRFTGARVNVTQEASIGERRATATGVQLVVQAPTLEAMRAALPKLVDEARKSPVFAFVDSDLKFSKPEVRVVIDRAKARTLGTSALDIASTLEASLSGQRFGYFVHHGKQYEVIGQLTRDFRSRPGDLSNIGVRAASGEIVRLDNLVSFAESSSPPELYRFNRYTSATLSGTLARGHTMSEGIEAFEQAARATLDSTFTTALTGAAADFKQSAASLAWVFVLALVLIYLVLAAQFESFLDPWVILLTVPLALAGALLALWCCNQTLNIFSQIGLIMLIGLVTKNGILIVELARQRRLEGALDARAAVLQAAGARLRPILMTTLATLLGILPIALALGAGAESRMSMGIVVIGGLLFGGVLTLFVIPAVYIMLNQRAPRSELEREAGLKAALGRGDDDDLAREVGRVRHEVQRVSQVAYGDAGAPSGRVID
jgi:multidrug efflux pump